MRFRSPIASTLGCLFVMLIVASVSAQTTDFTYQGKLTDGSLPPTANYDFGFRLFKSLSGTGQVGPLIKKLNQPVVNGIFSVTLDFGAQFDGDPLYLEISVGPAGANNAVTLSPRQPIASTPYSVRSIASASADTLSAGCVGCVTNSQISSLDGGKLTGVISGNGSGITNISQANITTKLSLVGAKRWDLFGRHSFPIGNPTSGICFDGTSLWVVNVGGNSVSKIRVSDGFVIGTYPVGIDPRSLTTDGANIWVVNLGSSNITKLRVSDGANLGTFAYGSGGAGPLALAFDGTDIWVTGFDKLTRYRASDGQLLGTVNLQGQEVFFDGYNIYVLKDTSGSGLIYRVNPAAMTFVVVNTFTGSPISMTFDGAYFWISADSSQLVRIAALTGNKSTYSANAGNVGFNGSHIYVLRQTGLTAGTLSMFQMDGSPLGDVTLGTGSGQIGFDGTSLWITSGSTNNVTRMTTFP